MVPRQCGRVLEQPHAGRYDEQYQGIGRGANQPLNVVYRHNHEPLLGLSSGQEYLDNLDEQAAGR